MSRQRIDSKVRLPIPEGLQRFRALCAKHGVEFVLAASDALLDYTERLTRAGRTEEVYLQSR